MSNDKAPTTEPEEPLVASLRSFGEAWAEYERQQRKQLALFADAVTRAVQAATPPGLPTAPGSVVSPAAGPNPGAEAILIGGRWLYSNDAGEACPDGWIGGWRLVRDAGKENA